MKEVSSPKGRSSILGFGCAGLTAVRTRRDALDLLACAFDRGVRHYDVARLYGMGRAEHLLGEFLRGRRDQVTVTTKFGITPPKAVQHLGFLVPTVKAALRRIPILDRHVRRRAAKAARSKDFSPNAARRSLEISLRALRSDYVDFFLLHEANIAEASDPDLVDLLEGWQRAGVIRSYGIGSEYAKIGEDWALLPAGHRVLQFDNSALCPHREHLRNREGRLVITHSAFKQASECARLFALHPDLAGQFRADTGLDVLDSGDLHRLLLAWAVHDNPGGLVLFGSTRQGNIRSNAAVVDDARLGPAATKAFGNLLHEVRLLTRDDGALPDAR